MSSALVVSAAVARSRIDGLGLGQGRAEKKETWWVVW